jgi:hypothetical protein
MNDEYRTDATRTGSEREQIEWFLHDNRVEVVGLLQQLVAAGRTPGLGAWSGRALGGPSRVSTVMRGSRGGRAGCWQRPFQL